MAQKDKVLEILALTGLPEHVKLARLAHQWIGKELPREQAKAIIKVYIGGNGRLPELTQALLDEKYRQEKIHNERQAFKAAAERRKLSPMLKYVGPQSASLRKQRTLEIAQSTFGPAVRENFNEDTLALMSLIDGEDRWYEVRWKDASFKPVRCALIEVVTMTPKGPLYSRFLLYKVKDRVLVARTRPGASTTQEAWAYQLPPELVAASAQLRENGYTLESDLEGQRMVVTSPDGFERIVPWKGATVDE